MKPTAIKKTFQYGEHTVTLECGEIARQASGAVMVSMGDTVVFVTAVAMKDADPGKDFFPMTVNYQERTYAAGKIPGGFFRREGRPSENETLISRLIDRPIRPLFPKAFNNEVQIVATVVSICNEMDSEIPSIIGASAALAISGVPLQVRWVPPVSVTAMVNICSILPKNHCRHQISTWLLPAPKMPC